MSKGNSWKWEERGLAGERGRDWRKMSSTRKAISGGEKSRGNTMGHLKS